MGREGLDSWGGKGDERGGMAGERRRGVEVRVNMKVNRVFGTPYLESLPNNKTNVEFYKPT